MNLRCWAKLLPMLAGLLAAACNREFKPVVVVYTSQDQVYAEPILREFGQVTGCEVRAVYDSEAVKTVGLANRLLAERSHPQCDVFWNNEALRTIQLAEAGVFREEEPWRAVGYRSRRIVINTNHLTAAAAPRQIADLTNAEWRGKIALAYPLFGTTATHFLALRQKWGHERWIEWCRALQANKPFLVDGNSVVVKMVGRGEAWVGLTDSDDVAAGQREGLPVAALAMTDETLLIPNTIGVIREAPHPVLASRLFEYLQQRSVLERLVAVHALEGVSTNELALKVFQPDWSQLTAELPSGTAALKEIFLR